MTHKWGLGKYFFFLDEMTEGVLYQYMTHKWGQMEYYFILFFYEKTEGVLLAKWCQRFRISQNGMSLVLL